MKDQINKYAIILFFAYYIPHTTHASPVIHSPSSMQDLLEIVKTAAETNQKISPYGCFHSIAESIGQRYPDQELINTHKLNRILAVDYEQRLVKVEAGILLSDLVRELGKMNMALCDMPGELWFTLAGVISTGAHGKSLIGSLPDSIVAIELVDGLGRLRKLTEDETPELLAAARVGLGTLGIIYSVTIACESLYVEQHEHKHMPLEDVLEKYQSLLEEYDSICGYFEPYDGLVQLNLGKKQNVPAENNNCYYLSHTMAGALKDKLMCSYFSNNHSSAREATSYGLNQVLQECIDPLYDYNYKTLAFLSMRDHLHKRIYRLKNSTITYVNEIEIALPLTTLRESFTTMKELFKKHLAQKGIIPGRALRLRFNKGYGKSLFNEVGNEIRVWLAIVLKCNRTGTLENGIFHSWRFNREHFLNETKPLLIELHNKLIKLGGRPHWGKMNYLTPQQITQLYGTAYTKFVKFRRDIDPHGIFLTPYTEPLFT